MSNPRLIIINGFLGSGKTTFLKRLINHYKDNKMGIIINEFGDYSIDDKLITDLNVKKAEIHSGSIFCSCKEEEFINKMNQLLILNMELIIVESSGFSNPTSLDRIINFIENRNNIKLNNFKVTICDAKTLHKIINTLEIVKKQIAISDIILLNKVDLVDEIEIEKAVALIKTVNSYSNIMLCNHCDVEIDKIFESKKTNIVASNYQVRDISLKSIVVSFTKKPNIKNVVKLVNELKKDVFRCKGFIKLDNDETIYLDLSFDELNYQPVQNNENKLVILYSSKIIGLDSIKVIIDTIMGKDNYIVS